MANRDVVKTCNYIERSLSWQLNRRWTSQQISRSFTEPEGSLPCSQEPATCSYSEPDESSPHPHILFL